MKNQLSRRQFLNLLAIGAAGTALPNQLLAAKRRPKPNVLVVLTDQQTTWTVGGAYQKALGDTSGTIYEHLDLSATPFLNEFMQDSVVLTNHFCNNQECSPSRASLFTGTYPNIHGAHQNNIALNQNMNTLMNVFKTADYSTAYLGKWHLFEEDTPNFLNSNNKKDRATAKALGVDYYQYLWNRGHYKYLNESNVGLSTSAYIKKGGTTEQYTTNVLFEKTTNWIAQQDKPWCCVLAIPDPHSPFTIDSAEREHLPSNMPKITNDYQGITHSFSSDRTIPNIRSAKAQYLDMVKLIDRKFGALVDSLKASGKYDNTIIVFTSDHGMQWGEHDRNFKQVFFDRSARVPMVIRYPNCRAKVVNQVTSHVDVLNTLAELAKIHSIDAVKTALSATQGHSFRKLLNKGNRYKEWKNMASFHSVSYRSIVTPQSKLNLYIDNAKPTNPVETWFVNRKSSEILENNSVLSTSTARLDQLGKRLLNQMDAIGDLNNVSGTGVSAKAIRTHIKQSLKNGWQT